MSEKQIRVPASKEVDLSPSTETVDAAENHGCVIEPKTVDAGADCGRGYWLGQGTERVFIPTEK
jgi:hypothetical protein